MSNLSELTLLYIEDDDELREQFVRILELKFKIVYEAVDGLDALQKFEQYSPDIMLVDINLPKIDGLEVIEQVRENNKDIPIIVLSAYSDQVKLLKAIKLGLSEYLIKPVPYETLLSLFDKMALNHKSIIGEKNIVALHNGYYWRKEEKIFCYHDEIITLTKREIIFLEFMVKHVNKIVTFESIENLIWEEEDSSVVYNSLGQLLKRLRKKLPEELIENIYGEGYRITSI